MNTTWSWTVEFVVHSTVFCFNCITSFEALKRLKDLLVVWLLCPSTFDVEWSFLNCPVMPVTQHLVHIELILLDTIHYPITLRKKRGSQFEPLSVSITLSQHSSTYLASYPGSSTDRWRSLGTRLVYLSFITTRVILYLGRQQMTATTWPVFFSLFLRGSSSLVRPPKINT